AGPLASTSATAALRTLATRLGAPLLADINSGLRCDGHETPVLALYNLYLRQAAARLPQADLVLYFGDRIVSEPLREYLAARRTQDRFHPVFPVSPAAGCHRERVHIPYPQSLGRSGCLG